MRSDERRPQVELASARDEQNAPVAAKAQIRLRHAPTYSKNMWHQPKWDQQLRRLPFQIERLSLTNSVNKLDIGIEIEMEFCTHCTQDLWNTTRSGILRLVRWLGPEAISVKATKSKSVGPSN